MNIQLIEGEFKTSDALDLVTQMIHIKIKYHENKISKSEIEEDIKARERKIKMLQKELFEIRESFSDPTKGVSIKANIIINLK